MGAAGGGETVLVTGGAGFIGSHVAEAMRDAGHRVVVVDDLSSGSPANVPEGVEFHRLDIGSEAAARLVAERRPRFVFHHAAQISVSASVRDPARDARVNVLGTLNLLQAAAEAGVEKFVFASTGGALYGEGGEEPVGEDRCPTPLAPYGVSKLACEGYLRVFERERGLRYVSLRYGNVYGPRQDPHGEAGVVAIFATRMLARAGRGAAAPGGPGSVRAGRAEAPSGSEEAGPPEPVVNGDGRYVRDYVYVGDVVRANLLAAEHPGSGAFNIGTGRGADVNELWEILARLTGYRGERRHGPPRPGDVRRITLDASRARRELGWEPRVSLEEGLRRTVAWFRGAASRPAGR